MNRSGGNMPGNLARSVLAGGGHGGGRLHRGFILFVNIREDERVRYL